MGEKDFEADPVVFASSLMTKPKKNINNEAAKWIMLMSRE